MIEEFVGHFSEYDDPSEAFIDWAYENIDDSILNATFEADMRCAFQEAEPINGEDACENQEFGYSECMDVGCCHWDDGECWSAVGEGMCYDEATTPETTPVTPVFAPDTAEVVIQTRRVAMGRRVRPAPTSNAACSSRYDNDVNKIMMVYYFKD